MLYGTSFASNTLCGWCDPWGTRIESIWKHCLLCDPPESKHHSQTPVWVTPRFSQGIHRSRAGKPGIEGLSLTRVHLLLCTVWGEGRDWGWGGGEGEGGSWTHFDNNCDNDSLFKKTEPPWPNHLPLLHSQHLSRGLCFPHLSFGEHINTAAQSSSVQGWHRATLTRVTLYIAFWFQGFLPATPPLTWISTSPGKVISACMRPESGVSSDWG